MKWLTERDKEFIMTTSELTEALKLREKAKCLYDKSTIEKAIKKVAEKMNRDLADKNPVLLCVMNGAVIFMGQIATQLTFPLQIDYVHVTRYQGGIEGREIHWVAEPNIPLQNRVVVIIEDILDGGLTLAAVKNFCVQQGATEVLCAALVDKKRLREPGGVETCEYVGLEVEDKFLIGYGLDFLGYFRNEPEILVVNTD